MTDIDIIKYESNTGINKISLVCDEGTLEAKKVVWYCTEAIQECKDIYALSNYYNIDNTNMVQVDANTYEYVLPEGLFLTYDDNGDLSTENVSNYLLGL